MSSACEGEEVFFDSVEQLVSENWVSGNSDYDIWLSEPESVRNRRQSFLSRMGFVDNTNFSEAECKRNFESHVAVSTATSTDEALLSERRKSNSEANCSSDYSDQDWLDHIETKNLVPAEKCEAREVEARLGKSHNISGKKAKRLRWLKDLVWKIKKNGNLPKESKLDSETGELGRVKVEHYRKRHIECTALYAIQQVKASEGLIRAMKFSPDGQYLASGGADGVVCIWTVVSKDAYPPVNDCSFGKTGSKGKKGKKIQACVVVPEEIFHIEEKPLHKFRAHSGDVLDLAWSTSNHLLSSSIDKTVCLWRAGSDECLGVFQHNNYVTSVQFNPADENCFISGSIDGKVRIWGVSERRVKDWADVDDIVTAVCYQPNGKGLVIGFISGNCRFYEISGDGGLVLNADVNITGKRKSSGSRITGIQFLKNDSRRVMVTSDDSKIRILDGLEVVRKYKGLPKTGCQLSASFTSSGRHILSVGDDSRIYLWNHDYDMSAAIRQTVKSERSCETLVTCGGPSVVVPWWGAYDGSHKGRCNYDQSVSLSLSLSGWFSAERWGRTWPEERLPVWDFEEGCGNGWWGQVFVTGNEDGTIRTFHNYGMPVRIG